MIRHQRPRINSCPGFFCGAPHALNKVAPVGVIINYFALFYSPAYYMMQGPRVIQSCLSWHTLSYRAYPCKSTNSSTSPKAPSFNISENIVYTLFMDCSSLLVYGLATNTTKQV